MIRLWIAISLPVVTALLLMAGPAFDGRSEAAGPAGVSTIQGNVNCVGGVSGADALAVLTFAAGVNAVSAEGGCATVGVSVIAGFPWGDVNCDGVVDIDDVAPVLRVVAEFEPEAFGGCVPVGEPLLVSTPTAAPTATPTPGPALCQDAGWTVASGSATWDCSVSPDHVELHVDDGEHILLRPETFGDVHTEADVSTINREAALVIRAQDGDNAYVAVFIPEGTPLAAGVQFYKKVGGAYTPLAIAPFTNPVQAGVFAHFEVQMVGTNAIVKVNGETLIDVNDSTFASGKVGLRAFASAAQPCDSVWDNIVYGEAEN